MSIPFLRVDSTTWTLLRNLMALEEQEEERPVTAYCYFMSQVACAAEDVELLQAAARQDIILEHFLGSDEQAARGFAQLCDGVDWDVDKLARTYLSPMLRELDRRCTKPVHNLKGFFRERYCGLRQHVPALGVLHGRNHLLHAADTYRLSMRDSCIPQTSQIKGTRASCTIYYLYLCFNYVRIQE